MTVNVHGLMFSGSMSVDAIIAQYGYLALFVGVFFEGETILIIAAFAAHQGYLKLQWVILTAFLGSLAGDEFYFFLGRMKGRAFLRSRPVWQLRVGKVQGLLERHHRLIIVGFRFLSGLRTVIPLSLGMSEVKASHFIFFNILGALAWSLVVGLSGFLFGAALDVMLQDIRRYERYIMLAILIVGLFVWTIYYFRKRKLRRIALEGNMKRCITALLVLMALCLFSFHVSAKEGPMKISSAAFAENSKIPKGHTCDGENTSPPLTIAGVPEGALSLALIVDDPDAPGGTWVHWVVWRIDAGTREIKAGSLPAGAVQGANSFRKNNYGGPCPPSGSHRYFFKLYALDRALDLEPGATKADLERAMKGHVVAEAQTMGRYR